MTVRILHGDALAILRTLPNASVHCCVTSPPYWGLRDYGTAMWEGGDPNCDHIVGEIRTGLGMAALGEKYRGGGKKVSEPKLMTAKDRCPKCGAIRIDQQIGLEQSPDEYVAALVGVFREVKRVLRSDATAWINLGDGYSSKQLLMMPARVALALQADGWWLRQDNIWAKRNCMPESIRDRTTRAHEYIFMLTKSATYFYDTVAIEEDGDIPAGTLAAKGSDARRNVNGVNGRPPEYKEYTGKRNKRSVWWMATQPFSGWAYDFENADYVDDRGIPRKVSQDCPAHGRSLTPQTISREDAECDEPKDDGSSRTSDSGFHPEIKQFGDSPPIANCKETQLQDNPSNETHENTFSNRTADSLTAPLQTPSHRSDIPKSLGTTLGSSRGGDSWIANEHNIQSRKTAHGSGSLLCDTVSSELPCRTSHTPQADAETLNDEGTIGNKNEAPQLSEHEPHSDPAQSACRKSRTKIRNASNDAKCICRISQLSHFAVYPDELPETCIKAGTSERGCCPGCGAPWRRVVERQEILHRPNSDSIRGHSPSANRSGNPQRGAVGCSVQHLGWRPTCRCPEHNPVPCMVLDPFAGAFTTCLVADRLGRDAIGIELSASYCEMGRARIAADAGMFSDPGLRQKAEPATAHNDLFAKAAE
jgi:DNA modification methylase